MANASNHVKRTELRMDPKLFLSVRAAADRDGLSVNEWMAQAADHYLHWQLSDYDVPTAEVQRLNQLTDMVTSLVTTQRGLNQIISDGFSGLYGLMHGGNYLMNDTTPSSKSDGSSTTP